MPLKKLVFKPGVNKENTRYTTEGGYYDCDKIRFRQGTPEKVGGWYPFSSEYYIGVCRSLWSWVTLNFLKLVGVGTNLKFFINRGGVYFDVTPVRLAQDVVDPFTATNGSSIIEFDGGALIEHGAITGDYVTYNGATSLGGAITATVLNQEFQITVVDETKYTFDCGVVANGSDTGHGGNVRAVYQVNVGPEYQIPLNGWGAGAWGFGYWGIGQTDSDAMRLWSQSNYGQDLIYGPRGGGMYYWYANIGVQPVTVTITEDTPADFTASITLIDETPIMFETTGSLPPELETGTPYYTRNCVTVNGITTFNVSATPTGVLIDTTAGQSGVQYISPRGVNITYLSGATDAPVIQNYIYISDVYRFVFAFGCNDYTGPEQDPLLIRWSDQENASDWTPTATNQAGSLKLSRGSEIVSALQTRQEIVVFTNESVYSLQYLGPPYVWGATLLGDNTSIVSQNAASLASGVIYWMGIDKFYKYDGRVQTMRCDLRQYIFNDINLQQSDQIFSGTNEGFNEVWWFYCSANSVVVDKYVVYNYLEDIWYYGSMSRTAWLDSGILDYPIAATYSKNIVNHEYGLDDNVTGTPAAIESYITTSEFDIDDGHNFGFVWRILPDITFRGSTTDSPQATMTLIPLKNSGSGYTDPASVGGTDNGVVTRTAVLPIEEFTQYLYIRVRGRQMAFKIENNQLGSAWQLGSPRIDIKPDGRR